MEVVILWLIRIKSAFEHALFIRFEFYRTAISYYNGLKNGEISPAISSAPRVTTEATIASGVGSYTLIPSGGEAVNYYFNEYQNGTLTVTPAPLTIAAENKERQYGDSNPALSFTCKGFKNGETSAVFEQQPSLTTTAGSSAKIGTYDIEVNGALAKNYNISYEKGHLMINKAPLTIKAEDKSRQYGDENPMFTFSYSGFKNGETSNVLSSLPYATSKGKTVNVGTYDIVPTGAEAENYSINYQKGTLFVTKAPLIVTVDDQERGYGENNPKFTATYSGFKNNDKESCFTSYPSFSTTAIKESNVGMYEINASGGNAANYDFTSYSSGTLTVKKADLSISANNASRLYFEDNPEFTYSARGLKNNDNIEKALSAQPNLTCSATKASECGEYDIRISGASSQNYALTYNSGVLSVNKRNLSVSVDDYSRVYKEDNPDFVLHYNGFVNNEDESDIDRKPTAICDADKDSDVGTYAIRLSGGVAQNYNFSYNHGTLNIEKAEQEIVWEQDLTDLGLGDQVLLTAKSSSGLDVEYFVNDNDVCSIYESNGASYLDCFGIGAVQIRAIQSGNKNYYAAARISKKAVVREETAIHRISDDGMCIETKKGLILIHNKQENSVVSLYSPTGELIYRGLDTRIHVTSGYYIIKVGNLCTKIIVR